jgi:hypothetical protein
MPPRTRKAETPPGDLDGKAPANGADLDGPTSADEYFIAGRLTIWASKILHGDDYAKVWEPLDPTNRQVAEFIQALEKITGIPFVGSAGSPTT